MSSSRSAPASDHVTSPRRRDRVVLPAPTPSPEIRITWTTHTPHLSGPPAPRPRSNTAVHTRLTSRTGTTHTTSPSTSTTPATNQPAVRTMQLHLFGLPTHLAGCGRTAHLDSRAPASAWCSTKPRHRSGREVESPLADPARVHLVVE